MPDHDQYGIDWEAAFERAYGAAWAVLRDAALAEEVAQDACVKALGKLGSFQGRCAFPSWVRSIAFRLAVDVTRGRRATGVDPDELGGDDDPEAGASSREAAEALHDCLSQLTERQLLIFLAKHLDGMKGAEIAAEMSTREGTIWATLSQTAANLRRCLAGHGIDRGALH